MLSETEVALLIRALAAKSRQYRDNVSLPLSEAALGLEPRALGRGPAALKRLADRLTRPDAGLRWVLGTEAFSWRGGEGYLRVMHQAFAVVDKAPGRVAALMTRSGAVSPIWSAFKAAAERASPPKRLNERRTGPLIEGVVALAREILPTSLVPWMGYSFGSPGGVERVFLRLVAIKGIGPKIASLLLGQTAWVLGLERRVSPPDRFLLQPVDIWVRRTAAALWPDLAASQVPSFCVARRIAETCSRIGVSGVEFNHGAWYFGSQEVKRGNLQEGLRRLL